MPERLTAVVDADIGSFMRGMDRVDRRLSVTHRAMRMTGTIGRAAGLGIAAGLAGGAVALTGIGVLAGKAGLGFEMLKQQATTAFKVMLGSGKAATRMIGQLQRFAAATPFEFKDLLVASQRMLALGWSARRVLPDIRTIGDAAAASPQGMVEGLNRITLALGQMKSKGKAQGDELLQLAEAGIPVWRFLAQAAHKSVAQMQKDVSKGAVTADFAISAILGGMKRKFGGMMAEQAKTLAGQWSTLKDNLTQAIGGAIEPLMPMLTDATGKLATFFGSADGKEAVATFGTAIGDMIGAGKRLADWLSSHDVFGKMQRGVEGVQQWLSSHDVFGKLGDSLSWLENAASRLHDFGATAVNVGGQVGTLGGKMSGLDRAWGFVKDNWQAIARSTAPGAFLDLAGDLGAASKKALSLADALGQVAAAQSRASTLAVTMGTTQGRLIGARAAEAEARKDYAQAKTAGARSDAYTRIVTSQMAQISLTRQLRQEYLRTEQAQTAAVTASTATLAERTAAYRSSGQQITALQQGIAENERKLADARRRDPKAHADVEQQRLQGVLARQRTALATQVAQQQTAFREMLQARAAYNQQAGRQTVTDVAEVRGLKQYLPLTFAAMSAVRGLAGSFVSVRDAATQAGDQGVARLANQARAGLQRISSMKGTTSAQLVQIGNLKSKADSLGKTKVAMSIVANSKSADDAIAKLKKITSGKHATTVAIGLTGVAAIDNVLLQKYPALKKGAKADVNIGVSGEESLTSTLSYLDNIRARNGQTTTIYVNTVTTTSTQKRATGGRVGGYARGGRAGRFSSPTFLVAEGGYPEWVIPTDPKYHQRAAGMLAAAADELGVHRYARGGRHGAGGPRLTGSGMGFRRGESLDARSQAADNYAVDTDLLRRRFERSGGRVTGGEWRILIYRLRHYQGLLLSLYSGYQRAARAPGTSDDAKQKREAAAQSARDYRNRYLSAGEDVADAIAQSRQPKPAFDVGTLTTGIDQGLSIARAGLGGNVVSLLKQKRARLMAAFKRTKNRAQRAAIADAIASVDSDLQSAGSAAAGGGDLGGGGGGLQGFGGGGGGPTTVTNTMNVTVQGNVQTERDFALAIRQILMDWARGNGGSVFGGLA